MEIKIEQVLMGLDGTPFTTVVRGGTEVDLTLRAVCINALLSPAVSDERTTGETKCHRAALAQTIYAADDSVPVTAEDIVELKELINQTNPHPLVVARAFGMLDAN